MARPPAGPSRDAYRAVSLTIVPIGAGTTLVYADRTRSAHLLPARLADVLQRCQTFAPLAEHARQQCRQQGLADAESDAVRTQLRTLIDAGLLISRTTLLELVTRAVTREPTPNRIASVGVVTCDRWDPLQRALASYIEHCRRHARTNDFVVLDDSAGADTRSTVRAGLKTLQSRYDVPILYGGREEKQRFARALVDEMDLPADVVRFALFGEDACGLTIGANRNALLLATAGDLLFSADDDTLCRSGLAADSSESLALVSSDPTEFRFFPDREAALRSVTFDEADILAAHERLLGQDLPGCVAAFLDAGEPDFDQIGPGLFRSLERGRGRVLVTMAGLVGDSGMGSPRYYLTLTGPSRARLIASEAAYHSAFTSRDVVRAVRRPTISDAPFCMTTFVGLDNRVLLPPFFPVQRNSDGVFALTLRRCFDEGYLAFVPQLLVHAPATPRVFAPDAVRRATEELRTADVLLACITGHEARPGARPDHERLRDLGRYLAGLGSLDPSEFDEFLRLQIWRRATAQAAGLEGLLRAHGDSPRFWVTDVKRALDTLRAAVSRDDYAVPRDLLVGRSVDEARSLTRRLMWKFGQLLEAWPDLVAAAKRLRAKDQRLVQPI